VNSVCANCGAPDPAGAVHCRICEQPLAPRDSFVAIDFDGVTPESEEAAFDVGTDDEA
jgi:hypothetical protein